MTQISEWALGVVSYCCTAFAGGPGRLPADPPHIRLLIKNTTPSMASLNFRPK